MDNSRNKEVKDEAVVIWIEGCDLSGKTEMSNRLTKEFQSKRLKILQLKEPSGDIREIVLNPDNDGKHDFFSERLLFSINHMDTLKLISENSTKYDVIIVDRNSLITNAVYGFLQPSLSSHEAELKKECYEIELEIGKLAIKRNYINKENHILIVLDVNETDLEERFKKRCIDKKAVNENKYDDPDSFAFMKNVRKGYCEIMESIHHLKEIGPISASTEPDWALLHSAFNISFDKLIYHKTNNFKYIYDAILNNYLALSKKINIADTMDMSPVISYCMDKVPELLQEKGFLCTPDDLEERIALLNTEIAELADAVNKGKGDIEEGLEVADIAIRLFNLPVMFSALQEFIDNNICKQALLAEKRKYKLNNGKCIKHDKYKVCNALSEAIYKINSLLREYSNPKYFDTSNFLYAKCIKNDFNIESVATIMSDIIMILQKYCEDFLSSTEKNLYDFVVEKMEYNFTRPYKFNTSEEQI